MILCLILALSLVATVAMFLASQQRSERAWAGERRELLNRIQHPEIVVSQTKGFETPDPEIDLSALVGQIDYSEEE